MKLRPATEAQVVDVDIAYALLKQALRMLKGAGAVRTVTRVRSALKSCEGACRHIQRRYYDSSPPVELSSRKETRETPAVDLLRRVMAKLREESGSNDPMEPFRYDASWEALARKADRVVGNPPMSKR